MDTDNTRVKPEHLARRACLYVRQSTLKQVHENAESARRQYGLRRRALALGWPEDRIETIDEDQGRSGADSDRAGFQRMVSEVTLGRVGIVLGLEVSRLARNNADWHRLLQICALSDTLILDEDGVYSPKDYNDRLLLGLKGTISEAELHVINARLLGGRLAKARRGELRIPLPVGLVYEPRDRVVLDPDRQVRAAIRAVFDAFERTGSARGVVRHFSDQGLRFPHRPKSGPSRGELHWKPLIYGRVLQILHNPSYAGAFAFGRTHSRRRADGSKTVTIVPRGDWQVLIRDHHPGYVTWERFEQIERRLIENSPDRGPGRHQGPPREGPALLQGLALCGICGKPMAVRYNITRRGRMLPYYICQSQTAQTARNCCQLVPGSGIDRAIAELLLREMTPQALELAIKVQDEISRRLAEADALRALAVQRAREEADLARRRYRLADPGNRLVVDELEREWDRALRRQRAAAEEYERRRLEDRRQLEDEQRRRIRSLAGSFPQVFVDPGTPDRERKRMVRLLIREVAIVKSGEIRLGVRLRGGALEALILPLPRSAAGMYRTPQAVVDEIDDLLDGHPEAGVAAVLRRRGRRLPKGGGVPHAARARHPAHPRAQDPLPPVARTGTAQHRGDGGETGSDSGQGQCLAPSRAACGAPLQRPRRVPVRVAQGSAAAA
jgi:DNA invertase Pin-like site-specific DNA recombinase